MVALSEKIQEKSVDQVKICGEYSSGFLGSINKDAAKQRSSKAKLYELCAKEHWERPMFECSNEEGPDHHKLYTFKVLVEVEEASTTLECYGNPRANKKAAANNAADGALWCLKHMGYQLKKQ